MYLGLLHKRSSRRSIAVFVLIVRLLQAGIVRLSLAFPNRLMFSSVRDMEPQPVALCNKLDHFSSQGIKVLIAGLVGFPLESLLSHLFGPWQRGSNHWHSILGNLFQEGEGCTTEGFGNRSPWLHVACTYMLKSISDSNAACSMISLPISSFLTLALHSSL